MKVFRLAAIFTICLIGSSPAVMVADEGGGDKSYLALGDSVPFGFIPLAGFEAVNASNFVGYPDYVGQAQGMRTVNGACPGEASGSFLDEFTPDNGCRAYRQGAPPPPPPFRGTQAAFAPGFFPAPPTRPR